MTARVELAIKHLLLRLRPLNRALRAAVERQGRAAKRLIRPDVTALCVTDDQVKILLEDVDGLLHRGVSSGGSAWPTAEERVAEPPPDDSAFPKETDSSTFEEDLSQEEAPTPEKAAKKRSSFWRLFKRTCSSKDPSPSDEPELPPEEEGEPEPQVPEEDIVQPHPPESSDASDIGALTPEEHAEQEELRKCSAVANVNLPLDQLTQALGLSPFEEEAVLLCAASELDCSYERIYAYILDDLNRRYPCVELLCSLTATSLEERLRRRHTLSRYGQLRRAGILQTYGEPATELRQELRLAPGVFDFLTGAPGDLTSQYRDRAEVAIPESSDLPPGVDRERIARMGRAISEGYVAIVGVWGPRHSGQEEVVWAIASVAGKPLRRWLLPDSREPNPTSVQKTAEAVQIASALGAILWIQTDPLIEPENELLGQALADSLAVSQVPVILTGVYPWRLLTLLKARPYAELELESPNYPERKAMWSKALPEVNGEQLGDLAARFRVSGAELKAIAQVARTQARLASNGQPVFPISDELERACAAVTRKDSHRFAIMVKPKRRPDDLILPPSLHQQVLEVSQFFRAWPRVAEDWGFGRLETGNGSGIKALFTGDSGTGKTLAAEVIAGRLNMPLLKVDLARVVSKWVGETEKHLEAAFREAEDSHAVLFFDECDALFGKRGEIQHGIDRYANLEVSYLLQRLEDHYGLVILASNLKDHIDQAFTRRFQIVIHFPRPEPGERRKIWEIAFPKEAPLDPGIDFNALSRLDMTGAGIVGAARTAALLAADEKSETITTSHVVRAVGRQYQREARILTPAELGPYAAHLREAR